jgi:hypothetical protein
MVCKFGMYVALVANSMEISLLSALMLGCHGSAIGGAGE